MIERLQTLLSLFSPRFLRLLLSRFIGHELKKTSVRYLRFRMWGWTEKKGMANRVQSRAKRRYEEQREDKRISKGTEEKRKKQYEEQEKAKIRRRVDVEQLTDREKMERRRGRKASATNGEQ